MAFYFDDDNDDNVFSQTFHTQSSQKQVSFSQFSADPLSQSFFSPEKQSQSSLLSTTPKREDARTPQKQAEKTFICTQCGSVDQYYHDDSAGGIVTCSVCFTQSRTFGAIQEELDYDESQHMAARNRDGTLRQVNPQKNSRGKAGFNSDGTLKRGRPAAPLEKYDKTQKPPTLDECLLGFQTVLQRACKKMCFELIAIPSEVVSKVEENDSESVCYNATQDQKQELYREVSKTVRGLWKAYLLSWNEGADFYSKLYPQIRFSFRDLFLPPNSVKILYDTLTARALEKLTQQIRQEFDDEEEHQNQMEDNSIDSDSTYGNNSYSDSADDRRSKKVKVEHHNGYDQKDCATLDTLFDLFNQKGKENEKIKEENIKIEDIPIPDLVLSNDSKIFVRSKRSKRLARNNTSVRKKSSSTRKSKDDLDSNDDNNDCSDNDDDEFTVASELHGFEAVENKKSNRKPAPKSIRGRHVFSEMIYYHNKLMKRKGLLKGASTIGRKEAALCLRPSMDVIIGILLVAALPHGVTDWKMHEWIRTGSLPVLNAFSSLLPKAQQETLSMISSFFSLPRVPGVFDLRQLISKIHVACGYRPPKVKLVKQLSPLENPKQQSQETQQDTERILSTKSLYTPGRSVRPSSVPLVLGQLVSELGFSQRVLNYSLAIMGLPISRESLKSRASQDDDRTFDFKEKSGVIFGLGQRDAAPTSDLESNAKSEMNSDDISSYEKNSIDGKQNRNDVSCMKEYVEWLPPPLSRARPHRIESIDQILAIVVVACKLIPNWERNHQYVFKRAKDKNLDTMKNDDRFIPWNAKQLRFIRNGETELDYLEFLEECIFFGKNYALPNFVGSLNKSSSPSSDTRGTIKEELIEEEETDEINSLTSLNDEDHYHRTHNTSVGPNDLVLGWKKNSNHQKHRSVPKVENLTQMPYCLTKRSDIKGLRTLVGPLGALIEYIAYKTGTCNHHILNHLIELDKELYMKSNGSPKKIDLGDFDIPIETEKPRANNTNHVDRSEDNSESFFTHDEIFHSGDVEKSIGTKKSTWDESFLKLQQYRITNGDCKIPSHDNELLAWASRQRKNRNKLSTERSHKLECLGFFETKDTSKWDLMFLQLRQYRIARGHCKICRAKYHHLTRWCERQRYEIDNHTANQVDKLDSLGFFWGKKSHRPPPVSWDDMFQQLLDYKESTGNCNVPVENANLIPLVRWMAYQRFEYECYNLNKHSSLLTENQILKLEDIGMNWNGPKLPSERAVMYDETSLEAMNDEKRLKAIQEITDLMMKHGHLQRGDASTSPETEKRKKPQQPFIEIPSPRRSPRKHNATLSQITSEIGDDEDSMITVHAV